MPYTFMVLDPGHFHAALMFKSMQAGIDPHIYVYAPAGTEVTAFEQYIALCNQRTEAPTAWKLTTYKGEDFEERMLAEKKGDIVLIAGKNHKKAASILRATQVGFHVLADKPMIIDLDGYHQLMDAFTLAEQNGTFIFDIMTERFAVTNKLQKELLQLTEIFGEASSGDRAQPAAEIHSVHHFFKYVSGEKIQRPSWYFDVRQQGEGIVDVSTHLIDLIQQMYWPALEIEASEIKLLQAEKWPSCLSPEQFENVNGLDDFPHSLKPFINSRGELEVLANGSFTYSLNGFVFNIRVDWNFEAEKGGDRHYARVRGSKADLIIQQGETEGFIPQLYVHFHEEDASNGAMLIDHLKHVEQTYAGIFAEEISLSKFRVRIPGALRTGHEAHFAKVGQQFLQYLDQGNLPRWEIAAMQTKYWLTGQVWKHAKKVELPQK